MSELVCCIDIGTTRLKVAAFDEELQLVALESSGTIAGPAARPYELDLVALPALAGETLRGLLAHPAVAGRSIAGLSVTGQRATVAELHGNGSPAGPALSWQDGRGHAALELLLARFGRGEFSSITGLPPSALWSISKILWLQEQRGASLEHDRRLALLPDFLLGWLGAEGLVTDLSSASLTGLLDLGTLRWCGRLLDELGLVEEQLPQLLPAGARIGRLGVEAARHTGLMAGTPLYLGGGDQQCAALGLGAVEPGEVALCLGTAAVVSCPVDRPVLDPSGRTFCTAHVVPGRWVLEGIHNAFGSSLGWVQAMLGLGSAAELLELAEVAVAAPATPDGSVLCFAPFLAGAGSPDYDSVVRGAFTGLTLGHGRAELARAAVEGVCLELRRMLDSFSAQVRLELLRIAGGPSAAPVLLRFLAELTRRQLVLSDTTEATLLGAAILAWSGAGRFARVADGARLCREAGKAMIRPGPAGPGEERRFRRYCRWVEVLRAAAQEEAR